MNVLERAGRLTLRYLSGRPNGRRLLIFTFHRVLDEPDPLLPEEPTAEGFETLIRRITTYLKVLPLGQAVELLDQYRLPPSAACITFDDGYRNNYENAAPVLRRYACPATFFITTGAVETGSMWNDLVIEGIRRAQGEINAADLGLGRLTCADSGERRAAIGSVIERIKYEDLTRRSEIAGRLYDRCCEHRPELMMTRDMLRELDAQGFEIGAHTINHPILARLDDDIARAEISGSRAWLADVLGRPPATFAYPNGQYGLDFTDTHMAMVRDAGFRCAVATTWGAASKHDDVMALPRFSPWEPDEFGYWLRLAKTYVSSYRR